MFLKKQKSNPFGLLFWGSCDNLVSVAEKKWNTPDSRKCNNCVDNSAEKRVLSAEDPSNNIKLEQANASPVDTADNGKKQCNFIK